MNKINNQIELQKAINPAYKKFKPLRVDIDHFKEELIKCIDAIKLIEEKNESEEHLKGPIKNFFKSTFYKNNQINTKERIDLAIYLGETINSDVGVIIEAKKLSNKNEFISTNNLNKKALQELLLYYLRERVDNKNNNIKHLIITNGVEWFFFKGEDFYNYFYKNAALIKEYQLFRDGLKDTAKNELFYNEIASKYIDEIKDQLPFVYLSLNKQDILHLSDTKISNIYKIFSEVHLLGHSFGNDSNKLNETFYKELLHIIGLEEVKEKSKRVIVRKNLDARDYGSLLENTIFTLEDKNYLHRVKNIPPTNDKAFIVGLELCITWINRILFLKLLESQLVNYNKSSEYKFLNFDFLKGFDDLNDLFFSALAKPTHERHQKFQEKYKHIPYLNSSLFEHNDVESLTFDITALKDEEMDIYASSILKDANGKRRKGKLNTLEYLFKFLEAYDFSAEGNDGIDDNNESKTLINASVLGLIFEKINGYKDGSFYTPGYITRFMCKESIRQTVLDKFKLEYNADINTFEDLKDYCSQFYKKVDLLKFNHIINTLRICDPAVGSGHFLVSALNEVIAIKRELNILCNEEGKRIPCDITIENDELYITYTEGELFEYNRQDVNSLHIQQTLFHEKQTIIENCLFGVDINPNSVNICRLRLWIELLKNAYYTSNGELQTLPNIDINIKCGNSLISRFALKDSLKSAFKNKDVQYSIEDYKNAVKAYKNTNSKTKKSEVLDIISTIKSNFKATLDTVIKGKISKVRGEYENEKNRLENLELFGEKSKKSEKDNLKKLKVKADKIIKEKEEIVNNAIYQEAFEWRFEFPEVLDNEGNFLGFDLIIGNPPYIRIQGIRESNSLLAEEYLRKFISSTGSFDIYALFVEMSLRLINKKGSINFIMPVKWTNSAFGIGLRQLIKEENSISKIINFGKLQIFEASTYTAIQVFKNNSKALEYYDAESSCENELDIIHYLKNLNIENSTVISNNELSEEIWTLADSKTSKILKKLKLQPLRVSDVFDYIFQGLATSKDDVYFLYNCKYENDCIIGFSKQLSRNIKIEKDLTKPLLKGEDVHRYEKLTSDKVVIFPYKLIEGKASLFTEEEIKVNFPNGYEYLKLCESALRGREKGRLKDDNFWYKYIYPKNLTLFQNEKLVAPEISLGGNFTYDLNGDFYSTTTIYGYIRKVDVEYSYYLLLAFMNSDILWYYLINTGTVLANGYFRYKPNYLKDFPLPKIDKSSQSKIEKLVEKLVENKTPNISFDKLQIYVEINELIFNSYDLNSEEIQLIKNTISRR